jgi:hypothetical protein
MEYLKELEQRVRGILAGDVILSLGELKQLTLAAKDHYGKCRFEQALENCLKAARGYELRRLDLERAYALNNAAKHLDNLFNESNRQGVHELFSHPYDGVYILYAELNETAASLFVDKSDVNIKTAGYAYYRAALGYALAGNAEKARENLEKADQALKGKVIDNLRRKIVKMMDRGSS